MVPLTVTKKLQNLKQKIEKQEIDFYQKKKAFDQKISNREIINLLAGCGLQLNSDEQKYLLELVNPKKQPQVSIQCVDYIVGVGKPFQQKTTQ